VGGVGGWGSEGCVGKWRARKMNHRQITVKKEGANGGNNIPLWHISRQLPSFIVRHSRRGS